MQKKWAQAHEIEALAVAKMGVVPAKFPSLPKVVGSIEPGHPAGNFWSGFCLKRRHAIVPAR
jgi:hypothetical protein